MIIFLLFLLLLSIITNIFLVVSLKKSFNQIDILEDWLVEFRFLIKNTYNKLKSIDDKGIFEKDDEVGVLFTDLLEIIKLTNKRIQTDDDNSFDINEKNKTQVFKT
jgi:hypothetical protein